MDLVCRRERESGAESKDNGGRQAARNPSIDIGIFVRYGYTLEFYCVVLWSDAWSRCSSANVARWCVSLINRHDYLLLLLPHH